MSVTSTISSGLVFAVLLLPWMQASDLESLHRSALQDCCGGFGVTPLQTPVEGAAQRDRSYWLAIADNDYAVPDGAGAFDLLLEMNALLGSTDPVLRDKVAYGAAARWIYRERRLSRTELTQLLTVWSGNLRTGIGDRGSDAVFLRSFSALNLSILAALDNEAPFMTQGEFEGLLTDALDYLLNERDGRGYETGKGWIHAAAHTADVLKFLARNPKLPAAAQPRILAAISQKSSGAGGVFVWGEDERLAQVARSIARRADFEARVFERWLGAFPRQHRELWAEAPAIDPERFAAVQNVKLVLRAAYVALSVEPGLAAPATAAMRVLGDTLARMQ